MLSNFTVLVRVIVLPARQCYGVRPTVLASVPKKARRTKSSKPGEPPAGSRGLQASSCFLSPYLHKIFSGGSL